MAVSGTSNKNEHSKRKSFFTPFKVFPAKSPKTTIVKVTFRARSSSKQSGFNRTRRTSGYQITDGDERNKPNWPTNKTALAHLMRFNSSTKTLIWACEKGKLSVVKHILSLKLADIEIRWFFGRTPVMIAAKFGQLEVFSFLVRQGCNLSVVDNYNNNLLHMACMGGNTDIVSKLLNSGKYEKESTGWGGKTPLMRAVYFGHRKVVDLLLREGCKLTAKDSHGNTMLHIACHGGHTRMIHFILSQKIADIDSRGQYGNTPLMISALKGHTKAFEILLQMGCKVREKNFYDNTVLHLACDGGHTEIVKYILSHHLVNIDEKGYRGMSPLMAAIVNNHREVIEYLIQQGCNLTFVDDHNNTVLHVACIRGHLAIVKRIISLNIVSVESKDLAGLTPVMKAAMFGYRNVVDFLVRQGCHVREVDNRGNTVLHLACSTGKVEMVKYLLTRGYAEKAKKNNSGRTPLQVAEKMNHTQVVAFLKA